MSSLYPNINNNKSSTNSNSSSPIFPARVKSILLNDDSPLFKKTKGWADLGLISFKPLYSVVDKNNESEFYAKPLFSNIKNYPIKEEIVLIISSPSYKLNTNPNSSDYYYFPFPLNLWNSMNNNAFPDVTFFDKTKEVDLGSNFIDEVTKSLLPEEGDVLIEGRFRNSIRFSQGTPNKKNNPNYWSSNETQGKPIIIISNNHSINDDSLPWTPTQEDINNDGSTIIISSNQEIPIDYSCKNLKSFNVNLTSTFNQALQIPDNNTF